VIPERRQGPNAPTATGTSAPTSIGRPDQAKSYDYRRVGACFQGGAVLAELGIAVGDLAAGGWARRSIWVS
jgi:hypothetical protein